MALNLTARLGLDGRAYEAGLSRAKRSAMRVGGAIKGHLAAAFGIGALVAITKNAAEFADKINDLARKTGVSTTKLQELNFAAVQSGTTIDNVTNSFLKIQDAQGKAMIGTKTYVEAFQRLGLSMTDVAQLSAVQIFEHLANRFQKAGASAQDLSDTFLVMGRAGKENIRLLTEGLAEMQKAAHESGAIIDKETIQHIADMKDEWAAFKTTMMPVFADIASAIMTATESVIFGLKAIWGSFNAGLKAGTKSLSDAVDSFKEGDILGAAHNAIMAPFRGATGQLSELSVHVDKYEDRKRKNKERREAKAESARRQKTGMRNFAKIDAMMREQESINKPITKASAPSVDSLARAGLFIGGRQNPLIGKADKQIAELNRVNAHLSSLNLQFQQKL